MSVCPWSWSERVASHPGCKHGDAKSFLDALLKALETRGIEYELLQDYRIEYLDKQPVVSVLIRSDQINIHSLGEEVGFDIACPYLERFIDEWIFVIPGWHLGKELLHYKYVGGRRVFL